MVPTFRPLVTFTLAILAVNVEILALVILAVVMKPVVIVATLATKAKVTFALLKVVSLTTFNSP